MSKLLAKLLEEPDYRLAKVIDKLESLSGYESHDIRLMTENQRLLGAKLTSLGLDPDDTNEHELIHALANKLRSDVIDIHKALEIESQSNPALIKKVTDLARQHATGREVLSIKTATAKRLLRAQPPKHLMKLLKYRGLESMLKREDSRKLFALLPAAESVGWNDRFASQLKKLSNQDYEMRLVEFLDIEAEDYSITKVTYTPLMGAVVLLTGQDLKQRTLEITYQMLQAEEILQADTFYLKSHQLSGDFNSRASLIYKSVEPPMIKVAGHDFLKWHHLKDLHHKSASPLERLAKIHSALAWWCEAANLSQASQYVVSLHLGDVFKSLYHDRPSIFNLKDSLRSSLIARYAQSQAVKDYITHQLDDKVIALDPADETVVLSPEIHSEFI